MSVQIDVTPLKPKPVAPGKSFVECSICGATLVTHRESWNHKCWVCRHLELSVQIEANRNPPSKEEE